MKTFENVVDARSNMRTTWVMAQDCFEVEPAWILPQPCPRLATNQDQLLQGEIIRFRLMLSRFFPDAPHTIGPPLCVDLLRRTKQP